jgi:hypothetical protein
LRISGTFFLTLYDCVKDAELNGYKPADAPATPP